MKRTLILLWLLASAMPALGAPVSSAGGLNARAAASIVARIPPDRLAEIPPRVIEAVRRGEIPAKRFAASLGLAAPAALMNAPTELQTKRFITHWLDHYTCVPARIDEDVVDEANIDGRCSDQKMSDGPSAPVLVPDYYADPSGVVTTAYWQAPTDPMTCAIRTTNVSRYFVTWVESPTMQNAKVWLGTSDYFKLWVNGALVLSRETGGSKPYTVDEYKAPVTLTQGWNLLVLKQSFPQLGPAIDPSNDNRYKSFSLRFVSDDTGTPVTDLVATFDPNCTEADPSADSQAWIPNVAHLPGAASLWRSDLSLFNGTHMKWQYRLRFYKEGNNSGIPDSEQYLEMSPFETLTFPDVLQTLFGIPANVKGYIAVLGQSASWWYLYHPQDKGWIQARTFNSTEAGTFGTSDPTLTQFLSPPWPVTYFGLQNGLYRSNLAVFPAINTGAAVTLRLTLFGPDIPSPLVKEYTGIHGFWQLNNVFDDLGAGSVSTDDAMLRVEILESPTDTYWFSYVTVLNGNPKYGSIGTSDPVYLTPGFLPLLPPDLN